MKTRLLPAGPLDSDRVVAFDFETTGLNPRRDEIIEAGVVRLQTTGITDTFQQLYHPTIPIPEIITRITGITNDDVKDQPRLEAVFPALFAALDGDWFVAHNAPFDRDFLRQACRSCGVAYKGIDGKIVDTLELSRLLLPWLPSHRLENVAAHFGVTLNSAHRAADDAAATGQIFFHLAALAACMDQRALTRAYQLSDGAKDGLRLFLERVITYRKAVPPRPPEPRVDLPRAILGDLPGRERPQQGHAESPEDYLGASGHMALQWPQFEYRAPQLNMANAVDKSFRQDGFLIAEAGTGVGKTVAYLLPALFWAMREKNRVVVATHTKPLQDQIFAKDLPALQDLLGGGFMAVLLKGRQNYICQRRLETLIHHAKNRLKSKQRRALLPLLIWVEETLTGDIEENNGFGRDRHLDIWSQIHSDGRHCIGPLCEHQPYCHYQKVRKAAKTAHIVLINHALLFADIATGHRVLGEYSSLIVDESHQLERAATESLAVSLNQWVFRELVEKLKGRDSRHRGLIDWLTEWTAAKGLAVTRRIDYEKQLDALAEYTDNLDETAAVFFTLLGRQPSLARLGGFEKVRIRERGPFFGPLHEEIDALKQTLNGLFETLAELNGYLDRDADLADPDGLDYARQSEGLLQDVLSTQERLSAVLYGSGEEDICWVEAGRGRDENNIVLRAVPLDIAKLLADQLYPGVERCVMTSATLSIRNRFDYALSRLGLHFMDSDRIQTALFGSPFEFQQQARLFVPMYMPSPKSPQFTEATAALLIQVFQRVHRGAMVLFTSYKMLKEVYAAVKPVLSAKGVTLMGQSLDGSRSQLLRRFREEHSSVLFGTSSFWEGVDVPGEALELLVLTKIPFDVPSEPVVEARTEAVQSRTGSGFMNFAVPEAIVKVRQGFGRLIRSGQDHGAVLLLDNRVTQTRYGRLFLEALPVPAQRCASEHALLEGLESWFEKK